MSRFARIAVPGLPHHVTQRSNRREPIFFEGGHQEIYCDLPAEQTARADLILAPNDATGRGAHSPRRNSSRTSKSFRVVPLPAGRPG